MEKKRGIFSTPRNIILKGIKGEGRSFYFPFLKFPHFLYKVSASTGYTRNCEVFLSPTNGCTLKILKWGEQDNLKFHCGKKLQLRFTRSSKLNWDLT